mmetsp:Transcript_593/g.1994  ORF Transcript_593/g.1994 Transcript_593/m.1994 type:complete len:206 (-) Transcript_593:1757-2374(-)|eukprot:CAMPEP_0198730814 /NCGR_PEP_ID=MMETSP1475-20131203/26452_1 /TAXON_ID= ORGANISM="Unidentified sp., Strain CCMP1999" /NCGR_SAMPLE_ID=MMETSP1475 /ASSEMBLY_ACC=CAM_ASM_001111 /LENGTH=205 /DNA_ID=CAMNT_0044493679 /DNA_START=115 /DNA_END=732 /DNA_ORIENTATION=+
MMNYYGEDKENNNHRQLTPSVRFQDAELVAKGSATPSFLRELEDSNSDREDAGHEYNPNHVEHLDVPDRVTKNLGPQTVFEEMRRMSVHVGTQIMNGEKTQRLEGKLYLRGRGIFGRWRKVFGSVAVHNHFGAVFFLFSYDHYGRMRIRDSLMIILANALVRDSKPVRGHSAFRLKTENKKWLFACTETTQRDHWVQELRSYANL